jgi:hypothetical protein
LELLESRYAMNADSAQVLPTVSTSAYLSSGQTVSDAPSEASQDASALGGAAFDVQDGLLAYAAYGGDAYGGDSYGGNSYGGDPYGGQSYNQAPTISDAQLVVTEGDWILQGKVLDDQVPAGRMIHFTGAFEGDIEIAADNTFSQYLEGSVYNFGSICATYTDPGGLSVEHWYYLS